jgi:hypothetical protein
MPQPTFQLIAAETRSPAGKFEMRQLALTVAIEMPSSSAASPVPSNSGWVPSSSRWARCALMIVDQFFPALTFEVVRVLALGHCASFGSDGTPKALARRATARLGRLPVSSKFALRRPGGRM